MMWLPDAKPTGRRVFGYDFPRYCVPKNVGGCVHLQSKRFARACKTVLHKPQQTSTSPSQRTPQGSQTYLHSSYPCNDVLLRLLRILPLPRLWPNTCFSSFSSQGQSCHSASPALCPAGLSKTLIKSCGRS